MLGGLLAALVTACGGGLGVGGTGSSGFDEAFVISSVLDEGTCQDGDGTEYCPTNVADPGGDGQAVDAELPPQDVPVDCTDVVASAFAEDGALQVDGTVAQDSCGFDVPVMPEGFESGVIIRVAVRVTGGDEPWQISDTEFDGTDPEFTAEIEVDPPEDLDPSGTFDVQVAILTFDPGAGAPPAEVDTLSESGAASVYVTEEVTVVTDPEPTPGATPSATPEPTATPRPTDRPTPAPTDEPSATATPAPTGGRTPTPVATGLATPSPARTVVPTPSPVRTVRATPTPDDRATPRPTDAPRPTKPPEPTDAPRPTDAPKPTDVPRPTDAPRPTPSPDVRPAPTRVILTPAPPRPTAVPQPTSDVPPEPTRRAPISDVPRPGAKGPADLRAD